VELLAALDINGYQYCLTYSWVELLAALAMEEVHVSLLRRGISESSHANNLSLCVLKDLDYRTSCQA